MKILNKITHKLIGITLMMTSAVCFAGQGALLSLNPTFPNIAFDSSSITGGGVTYDGTVLSIASRPTLLTFTGGGGEEFIIAGSMSLTATIDSAGSFLGGSYTISGTVTDTSASTSYSGVLLAGNVTDYGIINIGGAGGSDLADFALDTTSASASGTLKPLYDAVGTGASLEVTLEDSSYDGSFASSWTAVRAKGDIGPIPDVPPLPQHTIGFWKNHLDVWTGASLTICGSNLTQDEAVSILSKPTKGDKTVIMAQQLIASMLNEYVGNSCSTIPAAETWLCDHGGVGSKTRQWDGGEELKNTLDDFNNGDICP